MLTFIIATPYTWHGGGGSVGNRYFMSAYGLLLFVMPVLPRLWMTALPWMAGAIFTAPLVLNPFHASFYPGSYARSGPLRWLPVELTLVYDWPINTDTSRVRLWFGDHPGGKDLGFQIYFFDDNAYLPEGDKTFWTKGESTAQFLIKTDRQMSQAVLTLTAGPVPTDVVVNTGKKNAAVITQGRRAAASCVSTRAGLPVSGDLAGMDGVGFDRPRLRSEFLRGRFARRQVSGRARGPGADSVMRRRNLRS